MGPHISTLFEVNSFCCHGDQSAWLVNVWRSHLWLSLPGSLQGWGMPMLLVLALWWFSSTLVGSGQWKPLPSGFSAEHFYPLGYLSNTEIHAKQAENWKGRERYGSQTHRKKVEWIGFCCCVCLQPSEFQKGNEASLQTHCMEDGPNNTWTSGFWPPEV